MLMEQKFMQVTRLLKAKKVLVKKIRFQAIKIGNRWITTGIKIFYDGGEIFIFPVIFYMLLVIIRIFITIKHIMNFYNLPIKHKGNIYYFNKLLGLLLFSKEYKEKKEIKELPVVVKKNYQLILNPYLLEVNKDLFECQNIPLLAKIYAILMVFISKYSFNTACLLTKIPLIKFPNSMTAATIFNNIYPCPIQQRTLCLPRTLFVMGTSKSFTKYGTAFIGVFLPSRKMHAWVIESGCNTDSLDKIWLSYQPVVAITK